ncbi:hypothetical protein BaRGS_00028461, partial [Batillaria attramentaria]
MLSAHSVRTRNSHKPFQLPSPDCPAYLSDRVTPCHQCDQQNHWTVKSPPLSSGTVNLPADRPTNRGVGGRKSLVARIYFSPIAGIFIDTIAQSICLVSEVRV